MVELIQDGDLYVYLSAASVAGITEENLVPNGERDFQRLESPAGAGSSELTEAVHSRTQTREAMRSGG